VRNCEEDVQSSKFKVQSEKSAKVQECNGANGTGVEMVLMVLKKLGGRAEVRRCVSA